MEKSRFRQIQIANSELFSQSKIFLAFRFRLSGIFFLFLGVMLAFLATVSKETGVTALGVSIVVDLFVLCKFDCISLWKSRNTTEVVASTHTHTHPQTLPLTHTHTHRHICACVYFNSYFPLTESRAKQFRALLWRSAILGGSAALIVSVRLALMPFQPVFSPQHNPAAGIRNPRDLSCT